MIMFTSYIKNIDFLYIQDGALRTLSEVCKLKKNASSASPSSFYFLTHISLLQVLEIRKNDIVCTEHILKTILNSVVRTNFVVKSY